MHRTLIAPSLLLAACNLSSTVGENEGRGGEGGEATGAGTTVAATSSNTSAAAQTTSSTTTTAVATTSNASTSTGSGGTIQGAHVLIRVRGTHGWLGDSTALSITARPEAPDPLPGQSQCAVNDVPDGGVFDPSGYVPLDGIVVTASAPGESTTLFYDAEYRSAGGGLSLLPSGTPITFTFGPTSSLWPGQQIVVTTHDAFVASPALEPVGNGTTAFYHPAGQDMNVTVTGDALPYQVTAVVVGGMPGNPPSRPVLKCGAAPGASTLVPGALFDPLIAFRQEMLQAGNVPADTWLTLSWQSRNDNDVAFAGNFLTSDVSVDLARPLNFE